MNKAFLPVLLLAPSLLLSQYQYRYQLNHLKNIRQQAFLYQKDLNVHTSIRPLDNWEIDSLKPKVSFDRILLLKPWWHRKLFEENLVYINKSDFSLTIDPVVNFQLGAESGEDDFRYINTRGFIVEGRIGQKFTFYSSFLENQARFPLHVAEFIGNKGVVPGYNISRDFGDNGFDYGIASGEISYTPNRFFSFTLGQGRNFFGEGYRSMLISDVGFNYPFFRIETSFWKIKYVNLWAQLYDIRPEIENSGAYARKYLSSHYLSININKRLNLSFFEAIVIGDTLQQRGLDASFLNPVIFYRPVEFAVGSRQGNALLGFGASYKLFDFNQIYGQFVLDEFSFESLTNGQGSWVNKYGWQIGIKDYQTLGVKGLFTRLEYNAARPYTYSHKVVLTNYGHYNQALAHPWGANFHELILQSVFQYNRWELEWKLIYGARGLDTNNSNWGSELYISYQEREQDLNNEIAQGLRADFLYSLLRVGWMMNPATGLKIEAGWQYRGFINDISVATSPFSSVTSHYFFAGLRTEFFNRYYDF